MPSARLSILAVVFAFTIQAPALQEPACADDPLLCLPGKVIFQESFSTPSLDSQWTIPKGDWNIIEQALRGSELPADKHSAVIRKEADFPENFIIQFKFRFSGGKAIHCSFNGKGHICRATLTPEGYMSRGRRAGGPRQAQGRRLLAARGRVPRAWAGLPPTRVGGGAAPTRYLENNAALRLPDNIADIGDDLEVLDFADCGIAGEIPETIITLQNLEVILLGAGPRGILRGRTRRARKPSHQPGRERPATPAEA